MTDANEKPPEKGIQGQIEKQETNNALQNQHNISLPDGQAARPKHYGELKWRTPVYIDLVQEFAKARQRKPKGKKGPSPLHIAVVYGRIEYRCGGPDGVCSESHANIGDAIGLPERSVRRAIPALVEAGYVFKDQRDGNTCVYSVVPFEEVPGYFEQGEFVSADKVTAVKVSDKKNKEGFKKKEDSASKQNSSEKPTEPVEEAKEVLNLDTAQLTGLETEVCHAAGYRDFTDPDQWEQAVLLLNWLKGREWRVELQGVVNSETVRIFGEALAAIRREPNKSQHVKVVDFHYLKKWFVARWKAHLQQPNAAPTAKRQKAFTEWSDEENAWVDVLHDVDEDSYRTVQA
jgi:hypothetical protein